MCVCPGGLSGIVFHQATSVEVRSQDGSNDGSGPATGVCRQLRLWPNSHVQHAHRAHSCKSQAQLRYGDAPSAQMLLRSGVYALGSRVHAPTERDFGSPSLHCSWSASVVSAPPLPARHPQASGPRAAPEPGPAGALPVQHVGRQAAFVALPFELQQYCFTSVAVRSSSVSIPGRGFLTLLPAALSPQPTAVPSAGLFLNPAVPAPVCTSSV